MSPPNGSIPHAAMRPVTQDFPGAQDVATRRLSDKILAAFNHAYAVGEFEVANMLRSALMAGEAKSGALSNQRQDHDPLYHADLWVAFVDARNDYRGFCASAADDAGSAETALGALKDAYRRWSMV